MSEDTYIEPDCEHEFADLKPPHSGTVCMKCGHIPRTADGPDDDFRVHVAVDPAVPGEDHSLLVFHQQPIPINLTFNDDDGEEIGKFEYDKEKKQWFFEGDADESAKIFVRFCMAHFQSAIDGDRDGLISQKDYGVAIDDGRRESSRQYDDENWIEPN